MAVKQIYEVNGVQFSTLEEAEDFEKRNSNTFYMVNLFFGPDDTEGRFPARKVFSVVFEEQGTPRWYDTEILLSIFENFATKKWGLPWTFVMGGVQAPMRRWRVEVKKVGLEDVDPENTPIPFPFRTEYNSDNNDLYNYLHDLYEEHSKK